MQSLRESLHVLRNDQAKKSKEFLAKRENHHANKFRELQNTSSRKLEESSTKLGEAEATIESLTKQLHDANKTIVAKAEEMDDMRGDLDKANQNNRVLEEKLETLKTSHEKEKDEYKTRIAKLEKSLDFANGRGEYLELGVKMTHKLNNEKEGYVEDVTRLEGKLEEAKGAQREYEDIFVSESQKIKNGMALVAAAKEGESEDHLGAGEAILLSVHNAFSTRPQSKGSRARANKRKRWEMGNEQHNGSNGDNELNENVGNNEPDGSVLLQE